MSRNGADTTMTWDRRRSRHSPTAALGRFRFRCGAVRCLLPFGACGNSAHFRARPRLLFRMVPVCDIKRQPPGKRVAHGHRKWEPDGPPLLAGPVGGADDFDPLTDLAVGRGNRLLFRLGWEVAAEDAVLVDDQPRLVPNAGCGGVEIEKSL